MNKIRPLTAQQLWLLNLLGDDPDRFVAIRLNAAWMLNVTTGYDYLLVEVKSGGNLIEPERSERILRRGLYMTVHSLVARGLLASVGHVRDHGELFGRT